MGARQLLLTSHAMEMGMVSVETCDSCCCKRLAEPVMNVISRIIMMISVGNNDAWPCCDTEYLICRIDCFSGTFDAPKPIKRISSCLLLIICIHSNWT